MNRLLTSACLFLGAVGASKGEVYPATNNGSPGVPLPRLNELKSGNGLLDTTLQVVVSRLNGPVAWNRRSYNGKPLGPTLRVKPGDKLRILIDNQLGKEDVNWVGKFFKSIQQTPTNGFWWHDMDAYKDPNVTNLHLHGMHVDPKGLGDNTTRTANPGEQVQYEYDIPVDHPRGLFWYHPHVHGSSTSQLAQGMMGALVVEDDTLPPEIAAMEEVVMVVHEVSHSNFKHLSTGKQELQRKNPVCYFCVDEMMFFAGDALSLNKTVTQPWWNQCGGKWLETGLYNPFDCAYLLINGEFQP